MTIREKFEAAGQGGVFRFFDSLDDGAKTRCSGSSNRSISASLTRS